MEGLSSKDIPSFGTPDFGASELRNGPWSRQGIGLDSDFQEGEECETRTSAIEGRTSVWAVAGRWPMRSSSFAPACAGGYGGHGWRSWEEKSGSANGLGEAGAVVGGEEGVVVRAVEGGEAACGAAADFEGFVGQ